MKKTSFRYSFRSSRPAMEIFSLLLDVNQWWSGLYGETITGKSRNPGDEFMFKAGGGIHITTQRLVEIVAGKKLVWLVTKSNLSFLEDPSEWLGTQIRFELSDEDKGTRVEFTHEGLTPQIECYQQCTSGWTAYLNKLKNTLG